MADIQGIYNRLNSGSQYTPLSAETFGDWSMEAGDLVTVVKDGRSYVTPIMQGDLKWDGASKVTIESVGNREREPLGRMSRRKYSGGGGGYWNSRKAFTRIEDTGEAIELEAKARDDAITKTRALIQVQADRISIVVDEETGKIKPAEIVAAINNGSSSIKISADHIVLDGDAVASSLEAKDLWVNALNAQSIETTEDISCLGDLTVAGDLQVSGYPIVISDITVSGNTMTISYADGRDDVTFSKAVTLNGAWSNGTYTVTASPQGNKRSTSLYQLTPTGNTIVAGSNVTKNVRVDYANATGDAGVSTGFTFPVTIDASNVENPISIPTNYIYTTSGSAPSGSTNATTMRSRILQAIADSETLVFRVDCGGSRKYYHMSF